MSEKDRKDMVPEIQAQTGQKPGADVSERPKTPEIDDEFEPTMIYLPKAELVMFVSEDVANVARRIAPGADALLDIADRTRIIGFQFDVRWIQREGFALPWQTIDSAPRDGTPVIAWWPHLPRPVVAWCSPYARSPSGWTFSASPSARHNPVVGPTHWMPLPAPPIDGGEDE